MIMCLTVDASLLAAGGFGSPGEFYRAVIGGSIQVKQGAYVRADRDDDGLGAAATEPDPTRSSPMPCPVHAAG
jgi:hypothetical protein